LRTQIRNTVKSSHVEPEPRAEEPILNCQPEPKLRIAAPAPALLTRVEEIFVGKIMVAEEVFVNFGILILLLKSKKVIFKVSSKLSGTGAGARASIRICGSVEPDPEEIFSAPQHWRKLKVCLSVFQDNSLRGEAPAVGC
jgi:hypothetical protein